MPVALLALQAAAKLLLAAVAKLHQAVVATSLKVLFEIETMLGNVALTLPGSDLLDSREPGWPSPVGFFYFYRRIKLCLKFYRKARAANSTASINRATSSSVLYR